MIVAAGLPALQARRSLGLAPWSAELRRTILVAVATVGTACVAALVALGDTFAGLAVAAVLGSTTYAFFMWRHRQSIHLQALLDSLRGASAADPFRTTTDPGALMTAERETPTLSDYWAILRRRRRTIALSMAIVIAIAAVWVWYSGAQYASQASVVIRPILSGPFDQSRIDDVGAGTEAKVLDSTVVAELAAKKLHRTAAEAPKLLEHLTVDNPIGTLILNITYTRIAAPRTRGEVRRRSPTPTSRTASRPPTR